jgi:hypothetical protein
MSELKQLSAEIEKKLAAGDNRCKFFRRDTETCTVGCKASNVIRGNACPFDADDEAQKECECYR